MSSGPAPRRHLWWALSPAYTFGAIAFIPALHAALKLREPRLWWWAAGLVAGDAVAWPLLNQPNDSTPSDLGALLVICLAVIGTVHAFRLRGSVFTAPALEPGRGVHRDPAVQHALAARQRRAESAALAAGDPALARELRIGRPDLPRQYDDGGLVDLNGAPAPVLVGLLGLTPAQADGVVAARERLGRFQAVEDLTTFTDLPPQSLDAVRDRIILL